MAEAEGVSAGKAVLRIKRKRSADPADILCKYICCRMRYQCNNGAIAQTANA